MEEVTDQIKIGVSWICDACESLAHFHWKRILKNREETPAMREGTQLHMLILEPEKFYKSYCTDLEMPKDKVILSTIDEMKKFAAELGFPKLKGKKEEIVIQIRSLITGEQQERVLIYDDWVEAHTKDKEFISSTKWEALHKMRDAFMNHAFAKKYLARGKKEVEVAGFIDGWYVRGRLDWLVDAEDLPYVIVIDVKKCVSAKFFKFRNVIYDRWYFVQAALYARLIEMKYKKPCLYVWMAVEGTGPFIVEAYSGNEAMLEAGMTHARHVLKRLETAYETNAWPGYSDGMVQNIDIPNYGYDKAAAIPEQEEEEENVAEL